MQEVSLVAGSRRLDFETHVRWRETASMLRTMMTDAHTGSEPRKASFIDVDAPNVIVEAAKQAEDNDDVIVRLYECAHAQTRTAVHFGFPVQAAAEVNLMEEVPRAMEVVDDTVAIDFRPFEIKTLRLSL